MNRLRQATRWVIQLAAAALRRCTGSHRPRRGIDEATLATDYLPVKDLRRSRLYVYIRRDQIGGEIPETVVVAGYYFGTDEFHAVEGVPLRRLSDWDAGTLAIQDAFPDMPVADRHFIGTGLKWRDYGG